METLDSKIRTARKEHICDYCSGIIHIGEKYDWQKNICDGAIYELKRHLSCCHLVSELDMDSDGYGVSEDDFKECID